MHASLNVYYLWLPLLHFALIGGGVDRHPHHSDSRLLRLESGCLIVLPRSWVSSFSLFFTV
jgi:hypothetical protein